MTACNAMCRKVVCVKIEVFDGIVSKNPSHLSDLSVRVSVRVDLIRDAVCSNIILLHTSSTLLYIVLTSSTI